MNAHSSRSHVLVMLTVTKRVVLADGAGTVPGQKARVGKLYLVDLAGSERLKKSMSTGADGSPMTYKSCFPIARAPRPRSG